MPRLLGCLAVLMLLSFLSGCHRQDKNSTQTTVPLFEGTPGRVEPRGPHKLPDLDKEPEPAPLQP
jgi:hypothetical protein